MFQRSIAIILSAIGLAGGGLNYVLAESFIFIEQRPPFTSEDKTSRSTAVYLNEKGLVQRYECEDYQINELQEATLSAADIFKRLSAISLKPLPGSQEADPNLPPSQAHPGHIRIMLRQSDGAQYLWAGATNALPSGLQKLVQEALTLAAKLNTAKPPAGNFLRADILSADSLDEYRVSKFLKTVKSLNELDPGLRDALINPFRLIPVPAGKNPFSAFVIKGEAGPLPLLYDGTGYEVTRYSFPSP